MTGSGNKTNRVRLGDIEIIWVGSPAIGVADLADIDNYDG
jgi:hypothetical protein